MSDLEHKMQQVLFEMRWLLPWGATASYNSDGGHAPPGSKPPGRLDGEMPHEHWQRKWNQAILTVHKQRVYDEASSELEQWRRRPEVKVSEETTLELEARMVREGDGWSVQDVANHFNCTPTFVRRVRVKAGVNLTSGAPAIIKPMKTGDDESIRAHELADQGLSERQIRMILGCGGSKLQRLLGRAA